MTKKKLKKKLSLNGESSFLLTDSLIIVFMLFIPYAFYLYDYFPNTSSFESSLLSFESGKYESVKTLVWVFFSKLVPLLLLILWFVTCKYWWFYSLGIPIAVYVFQLASVLNDGAGFVDKYEFVYSLPFTIIILGILLLIRNKISIYLKAVDLNKQADDVINEGLKRREQMHKDIENRPSRSTFHNDYTS